MTTLLREIVFDTETTGTEHQNGDRVVEIGAIELLNHIPTGNTFHRYLNPQRKVHPEAFNVHGLSDEFLSDKPLFASIADELHAFFGDAHLVAHNATFDIGFLNAEFGRTGHPLLTVDRMVDTLHLARRKHPGASNSLDALCLRYGVDTSRRTKHGALLDSELLADVYIELLGGRQADLGLAPIEAIVVAGIAIGGETRGERVFRSRIDPAERALHAAFIDKLGAGAIWRDYLPASDGA